MCVFLDTFGAYIYISNRVFPAVQMIITSSCIWSRIYFHGRPGIVELYPSGEDFVAVIQGTCVELQQVGFRTSTFTLPVGARIFL